MRYQRESAGVRGGGAISCASVRDDSVATLNAVIVRRAGERNTRGGLELGAIWRSLVRAFVGAHASQFRQSMSGNDGSCGNDDGAGPPLPNEGGLTGPSNGRSGNSGVGFDSR